MDNYYGGYQPRQMIPYNYYDRPNISSTGQVAQPQTQNSILTIFVNSEEEVNFYPVAAGLTVMLVSFDLGKFWLKTTGKNGVPEPIRKFDFKEEIIAAPSQPQTDLNFATKDEMQLLSDKLDKLISSLGGDN